MLRIKLNRQDHTHPDFNEIHRMLAELRAMLDDMPGKEFDYHPENNVVLEFQDNDGSFSLLDSFMIESDSRVEYCYMPTYICTAILMRAYYVTEAYHNPRVSESLAKAMKMCCGRGLKGHGFDGFKGLIEAIEVFRKADVREFLDAYPDLCPEFTEMFDNIRDDFGKRIKERNFTGGWMQDFESDIRDVYEYLTTRNVFVYGTLMEGESNHDCFLSDAECLGNATAAGFDMYDLGAYPGITKANGKVKGELYTVRAEDIERLDYLEGEGSLYIREFVTVVSGTGEKHDAYIYVYNLDVDGAELIPEYFQPYTANWKTRRDNLVWYVSYGSNMLYERFMYYIKGGRFENGGAYHEACRDTTQPLAVCTFDIPYDMYYGNSSGSWGGSGVSFLDISQPGKAFGVAYLITKEQFRHVSCQENGGTPPELCRNWYNTVLEVGVMDGCKVVTITNSEVRSYNTPGKSYLDTLFRGLKENYPNMSDRDTRDYLKNCIR